MTLMNYSSKCEQEFKELCELIPGGVNSGARAFIGMDRTPVVLDSAKDCYITDVDGKVYIDYCCSWGAIILGHAHPKIVEKTTEQIQKGSTYGLTHSSEKILAKTMIDLLPCVDKIRFFSSGTEATMTAIRLARGYTKRDKIIKFNGNYHGHADPFLVNAGSSLLNLNASASSQGVPQSTIKDSISLPYNDPEGIKKLFQESPHLKNEIAAIILEPIAGNMGLVPATHEFITTLKNICLEMGALLIFDEVISGFRVGLLGAQAYFNITPDLSTYGKIIGGGFPAAALGGRKEVMDHLAPCGEVFQAGTLSGNPVAMVAGAQTLECLKEPGFFKELEERLTILTKPLQLFVKQHQLPIKIEQIGIMFTIFWGTNTFNRIEDKKFLDLEMFKRFFNYMLDAGFYIPPSQFEVSCISLAHPVEKLEETKEAILTFIKREYL
jgi:glutamate-1-semialdehyde 2,1-aminomutase